jgi:phosphatidylglycerol:prolipoprotein diacylglycerol transferase
LFWFVFGAVLGAKIGYVIVYDPNAHYQLTRPWLIFNPFKESGKFVGISGLSYHGAITGAVIALLIFARRHKIAFWRVADLAAVSGSAGYAFGRLGNFFNAELLGRETAMPWGINVQGVLRHPSALYEAFLEGIVIFAILFALYKKRKFAGQMAIGYLMLYAVMRFIAEFWREPDAQLGFIAFGWLSMGQALSALMFALSLGVYLYLRRRGAKRK